MAESWKGPEEDNMSIGELAEWLLAIPENRQHLPVRFSVTAFDGREKISSLNVSRLSFTDGQKYYAESLLKSRTTFEGIYLEIDGE